MNFGVWRDQKFMSHEQQTADTTSISSIIIKAHRLRVKTAILSTKQAKGILASCTKLIIETLRPSSMEQIARHSLTRDTVETVLACADKSPLIYGYWIDLYDSQPELVAIAFSKLIGVDPLVRPYVLQCLSASQRHLDQIRPSTEKQRLIELLVCSWRLARYDLVLRSGTDPRILAPLLQHDSAEVRYLAIQGLGIFCDASDSQLTKVDHERIGAETVQISLQGENTIDLRLFEVEEARRLARSEKSPSSIDYTNLCSPNIPLPRHVVDVADVLLPKFNQTSLVDQSLALMSQTTKRNMKRLAEAFRLSNAVMVEGGSGSGKIFLIERLAQAVGKYRNIVRIHLGAQTDTKLLLGTYVTAAVAGQFTWQEGVLTKAVRRGRWLLIEDIDKASPDVLSILLPLLEQRKLVLPSRDEEVQAHPDFRIFTTRRRDVHSKSTKSLLGLRLWSVVLLDALPMTEMKDLICSKFPSLRSLADKILEVFYSVIELSTEIYTARQSYESSARSIGIRDLLKWCRRIDVLLGGNPSPGVDAALPHRVYSNIFCEAVDCFAASRADPRIAKRVGQLIGRILELPPEKVDEYLISHCPAIEESTSLLSIGRASIWKQTSMVKARSRRVFADTNQSRRLLEQLVIATNLREPMLLVGETGTGKTAIVQHLAAKVGKPLTVINMSQQTESGDLLGGYKPVDVRTLALPILETFEFLFEGSTKDPTKNTNIVRGVRKAFHRARWDKFASLLSATVRQITEKLSTISDQASDISDPPKQKRRRITNLSSAWSEFAERLAEFDTLYSRSKKSFLFSFVEGILVRSMRNGDWVLLDEINLSGPDTLESIHGLLHGEGSIVLSEKGDIEALKPHEEFRIFACMNPATDVGKRDLQHNIRCRFTEVFVESPDTNRHDLEVIIRNYIGHLCQNDEQIPLLVAEVHMEAKALVAQNRIVDGSKAKPHYSIRTLARTLTYAAEVREIYGLKRALYESFCMSYLTLLDVDSRKELHSVIMEKFFTVASQALFNMPTQAPQEGEWVQFKHYWLLKGRKEPQVDAEYVLTQSVEENLLNLARAATTHKYPILLQGPTSSGKTSMVEYLAACTGHTFMRINNHEHTDLQEYLGTYASDEQGNLSFEEGILITALRQGYWLVLDELNLAPSDVLEALNRLLDDNRELLIPETQEIVKPHSEFMLFATQNPAGLYGGRKYLSRAFRNRFLELHFNDLPQEELEIILSKRCRIAPSYCRDIIAVYKQLTIRRQSNRLFEQKNSFATLRDLFRWANRPAISREQLAENGYLLLAERVRREDEKLVVREVIEKVMKVSLSGLDNYSLNQLDEFESLCSSGLLSNIVWTRSMRRLFLLVVMAFRNNEPVLLVGETGCGKTTICQEVAHALHRKLTILNAHQNTETADILGALRPVRDSASGNSILQKEIQKFLSKHKNATQVSDLETLRLMLGEMKLHGAFEDRESKTLADELESRCVQARARFEWADGPLVQSMKQGEIFLIDEISLAEDAVLERLNSVLETKRSLVLAEKGGKETELIAHDGFQICATMNPGGDFGKKELSPALRNRFTEIWVPAMSDDLDIQQIMQANLPSDYKEHATTMLTFAKEFSARFTPPYKSSALSIRDLLAWSTFCSKSFLPFGNALVQGAAMVYIDTFSIGGLSPSESETSLLNTVRSQALAELSTVSQLDCASIYSEKYQPLMTSSHFSIGPFTIAKGSRYTLPDLFVLEAPTTLKNATRVLRAMQLSKPILLEGSPGVGKTSLVSAIADLSQNQLVRINLCEQTDLVDLFGSDAPVEDSDDLAFAWKDGPFLQAMQTGAWVLLDEMNLASQSILEGLNACLDHRGEAFIPELNRTFTRHKDFRIFAAQNPYSQGGGRKGLPKSFVNRFTVVYCDPLDKVDFMQIALKKLPDLHSLVLQQIVDFIFAVVQRMQTDPLFAMSGRPWELNLRDVLRWLKLLEDKSHLHQQHYFVDVILRQRMRTQYDHEVVDMIAMEYFGEQSMFRPSFARITAEEMTIGRTTILRNQSSSPSVTLNQGLKSMNRSAAESVLLCIKHSWPCLLVGNSGCGKSSLIHSLGHLLGHSVHSIAMNTDMDANDLLGSFEQHDSTGLASRVFAKVTETIKSRLREFDLMRLDTTDLCNLLEDIRSARYTKEVADKALTLLITTDWITDDVVSDLENLSNKMSQDTPGHFQWVDGALVKAAQEGSWVILDNANLCNASVLDRLNSLMEVNGRLIINERILPDGCPMTLCPHPNFRLFLTVDPSHGELSRAMRNRCVEIFLPRSIEQDDTFLPTIRAEQSLWFSIEKTSKSIRPETSPDEAVLAESIFCQLPRRFEFHRLSGLSDKQNRVVQTVFDLYANSLIKTILGPWSGRPVCSTVSPFVLETSGKCSQSELLHDCLLQVGFLVRSIENVWNDRHDAGLERNMSSLAVNEARILSRLGTVFLAWLPTIIAKHDLYILADTEEVQIILRTLTLFEFIVHKVSLEVAQSMSFVMLPRVWQLMSLAPQIAAQPDLNRVIESSKYVAAYESIVIMQVLWLKLRPALPNTSTTRTQFNAILAIAQQVDSAILSDTDGIGKGVVLKERCISTLRELSHASSSEEIAKVLPVEFDDLNRPVNSPVIVGDREYKGLFTNLLWKLQLEAQCTFEDWKIGQFPGFTNLCLLGAMSEANSVNLLGYIDQRDKMAISYASRFSTTLHAFLKSFLSIRSSTSIDSNLSSQCRKIIREATKVPLREFEKNMRNLKQVRRQFAIHGNDFLRSTLHQMGYVILYKLQTICNVLFTEKVFSLDTEFTTMLREHRDGVDKSLIILAICDKLIEFCSQQEAQERLDRVICNFRTIVGLVKESQDPSRQDQTARLIGSAWIQLGRLFLLLYLPAFEVDPAMASQFDVEYSEWFARKSACRYQAECVVHKGFNGSNVSPRTKVLAAELEKANLEKSRMSHVTVYRPTESRLWEIQAEFEYCRDAIDDGEKTDRIASRKLSSDVTDVQDVDICDKNWEALGKRLEQHDGYTDITFPVVEAVNQLRTGLALIKDSLQAESQVERSSELFPDAVGMLHRSSFLVEAFSSINLHHLTFEEVCVAKLQIILLHGRLFKNGAQTIALSQTILDNVFRRWHKQNQRDKQEDLRNSSIFRYTATEVDDEGNYQDLFPDYENEQDVPGSHARETNTNIHELLLKTAMDVLESLADTGRPSTVSLLSTISSIAELSSSAGSSVAFTSDVYQLAVPLYMIDQKLKALDSAAVDRRSYDFYRDSNIAEAKQILPLLAELDVTITRIKDLWPENAVLQEISERIQRLLILQSSAPLAQILTMFEQMSVVLSQWQEAASKELSIQRLIDALSQQIVKWRRFELSCWPHLLDHEEHAVCAADLKGWYVLYEMLVFAPLQDVKYGEMNLDYAQLIVSLMHYIRNCTVGQYSSRLRFLRCLSLYLSYLSQHRDVQRLVSCVSHVCSYYSSFSPQIKLYIGKEREALAKEMGNLIKLASWKDINVYSLRESARKSHRALYVIVRKYRRILQSPVSNHLLAGIGAIDDAKIHHARFIPQFANFMQFPDTTELRILQHSRPEWVVKLLSSASIIKRVVTSCEVVVHNQLQLVVERAIKSMKSLQNETPSSYDKNQKSNVANLKRRKKKLLTDSFSDLKSLGLSKNLPADKLQRQEKVEQLFLMNEADIRDLLPNAVNSYFFRIVDIIPKIRDGLTTHAEDISTQEIERGIGYFDFLLFHLLQERRTLIEFAQQMTSIRQSFARLRTLTGRHGEMEQSYDTSESSYKILLAAKETSCRAMSMLELLGVIEACHQAYCHSFAEDMSPLNSQGWWCKVVTETKRFSETFLWEEEPILADTALRDLVFDFEHHLADVLSKIQDNTAGSKCHFIFKDLGDWITAQQPIDLDVEPEIPTRSLLSAQELDMKLGRFCRNVLAAAKKIREKVKEVSNLKTEDAWFKKYYKLCQEQVREVKIALAADSLAEINSSLQSGFLSSSQTLQAVLSYHAPTIEAYVTLCETLFHSNVTAHQYTSRCTLFIGNALLNLASKGFCSPAATEGQSRDSKNTTAGTGLGDGQGAQDITQDLESDEEVDGLEASDDVPPEKEDTENRAKEMESGVGGELEDVENDAVSNSEEDDNNAEDDLEEEIGQVDDKNDTALDESMLTDDRDDLRNKETDNEPPDTATENDQLDLVDKAEPETGPKTEGRPQDQETMEENQHKDLKETGSDLESSDNGSQDDEEANLMDTIDNLELPDDLHLENELEAKEDEEDDDSLVGGDDEQNSEDLDTENAEQDAEDHDQTASMSDAMSSDHEPPEQVPINDQEELYNDETQGTEVQDKEDENYQVGEEEGGRDNNMRGKDASEALEGEEELEQELEIDVADTEMANGSNDNGRKQQPDGETAKNTEATTTPLLRSLAEKLEKYRRVLHISEAMEEDAGQSESRNRNESQELDEYQHIDEKDFSETQAMGPGMEEDAMAIDKLEDLEIPELENNNGQADGKAVVDGHTIDEQALDNFNELQVEDDHKGRLDAETSDKMDLDDAADDQMKMNDDNTLATTSYSSWQYHEQNTRDLANGLTEQLRLILEPTLATKMNGDYRTGKRLNMRRIIPYIASEFRKDKIWLRRSKPGKRQYQVMLAIDDSKSMSDPASVQLTFDSVALVATALSILEVGQMAVVKFGSQPELVHGFQDQFATDSGAKIRSAFSFNQESTNIEALTRQSLELFRSARAMQHTSGAELWQLQFIISDGIFNNHDTVKRLVRQCSEERIMVIFVVIATPKSSNAESIMDLKQASYEPDETGKLKLNFRHYMSEFAFENRLIVQNIAHLPELLCSALRQFFLASQ